MYLEYYTFAMSSVTTRLPCKKKSLSAMLDPRLQQTAVYNEQFRLDFLNSWCAGPSIIWMLSCKRPRGVQAYLPTASVCPHGGVYPSMDQGKGCVSQHALGWGCVDWGGGVCGQRERTLPPTPIRDGYCSGRYASC